MEQETPWVWKTSPSPSGCPGVQADRVGDERAQLGVIPHIGCFWEKPKRSSRIHQGGRDGEVVFLPGEEQIDVFHIRVNS